MKKAVHDLYERGPRLRQSYVEGVLGLSGEAAAKVSDISGGISREEAEMLFETVTSVDPVTTLEIGLGYGFSAMVICEAADRAKSGRRHIVIDPHQVKHWNGEGLANLRAAGHGEYIEFHERRSYEVLPELLGSGLEVDFAFIDGWHTFDFVFVDFFFVDKTLRRGGVVAFDDADWPSIRPIIRYVVTNLNYTVYRTMPEKRTRAPIDIHLGIQGSCIALRKPLTDVRRDIFFHRQFQ
jgi:predicted O-methyltransferase YrrM